MVNIDSALLLAFLQLLLLSLCIPHALLFKSDSRALLGWVGFMIVAPLAGPLCYWLFGINRVRRKAQNAPALRFSDQGQLPEGIVQFSNELAPLEQVGARVTGQPLTAGNRVLPLFNGEQAYPVMLEAIAAAKEEVLLASFIFDNDALGAEFIAALGAAARRGVLVAVLLDDLGRRFRLPSALRKLKRAGVRVRCYMPLRLLPPSLSVNLRNHRKLLVVDRRQAFTGGMNISARHLLQTAGASATADVHFEVLGPVVTELVVSFVEDWKTAAGEDLSPRSLKLKGLEQVGQDQCRVVEDGPNEQLDRLPLLISGVISAARHRVWIKTPYFLPDERLVGALQSAVLRGVDVRVVIPLASNWSIVDWASSHGLWRLVNVGVQVYRERTPFCHGKYLLVDDDYALIGSANLDPRSLRLNFELNLEVLSATLSQRLRSHCARAQANAAGIDRETLRQRGLLRRLGEAVAAVFSPYL